MTKTATERWLEAAVADAERRGLPELKPLLEGLAASTTAVLSTLSLTHLRPTQTPA